MSLQTVLFQQKSLEVPFGQELRACFIFSLTNRYNKFSRTCTAFIQKPRNTFKRAFQTRDWSMSRVCYGNQPFPFFPLTGFHFSLAEREKNRTKKGLWVHHSRFSVRFFFLQILSIWPVPTYEDRKNHPQTGSPLFSLCVHFQLKNPFGESMTHIFSVAAACIIVFFFLLESGNWKWKGKRANGRERCSISDTHVLDELSQHRVEVFFFWEWHMFNLVRVTVIE